jgi:hypothetical protein
MMNQNAHANKAEALTSTTSTSTTSSVVKEMSDVGCRKERWRRIRRTAKAPSKDDAKTTNDTNLPKGQMAAYLAAAGAAAPE